MRQEADEAIMPRVRHVESGAAERVAPQARRTIRRKLLAWYDRNRRDLPWRRRSRDPYAQWVAEIMLQQTRVDTVKDYYVKFLQRFPSIDVLARARHETVLKHWEGLGYYRRALHLHQAAQQLRRARRDIPESAEGLRQLPGVGEYTAAAVASIAFNERRAAVDGNVLRVIARLLGIESDILTARGKAEVTAVAQDLTPPGRPGDFNQAWMDLGSAICTPQSPDCGHCPLRSECVAARHDRVDELPVRDGGRRGRSVPQVLLVVAVLLHDGKVLLRRRPRGGLWSGLWEFPNAEVGTGARPIDLLRSLARAAGASDAHRFDHVATVAHRLTHRAMTFDVYFGRVDAPGEHTDSSERWVTIKQLTRLSLSTAHRRILEAALPRLRTMVPTAPPTRKVRDQ